MAYRECPNHGWLETGEYVTDEMGETICPVCEIALSGHRDDTETRRKFGQSGGPTHKPRRKWVKAQLLYIAEADHMKSFETREEIEERYSDVEAPE